MPLPEGFAVSDRVRQWAAAKGHDRLDEHLEAFVAKARARSYAYADWDAAFMEAVRENWAGLPGPTRGGRPGLAPMGRQAALEAANRAAADEFVLQGGAHAAT